jgi:hypothetical protein
VTALLVVAAVAAVFVVGFRQVREARRIDAAWKRVGTCAAVSASSPEVRCTGVDLVELALPSSFPACREIQPLKAGRCVVEVNREALSAFAAAVAEVEAAGLDRHIQTFGTVNRRRCRDARTGSYIPGCISKHSYGIAVDFRPFADNSRWDAVVRLEPGVSEIVEIFRSHGFRWGMEFGSNPDPQHLEWRPR